MRSMLLLAALTLATPALAKDAADGAAPQAKKGKKAKGPREGRFCKKKMVGKTAKDAEGNTLECKMGEGKRARWTKQ